MYLDFYCFWGLENMGSKKVEMQELNFSKMIDWSHINLEYGPFEITLDNVTLWKRKKSLL